ncbi:hypothetical protein F4780DRAFT_415101 [Xylariomycetidae sp. FL0641]|nr:hypothetical protein F4780DRAFT_415101 [Xylariomycetidae sp. FL0641]
MVAGLCHAMQKKAEQSISPPSQGAAVPWTLRNSFPSRLSSFPPLCTHNQRAPLCQTPSRISSSLSSDFRYGNVFISLCRWLTARIEHLDWVIWIVSWAQHVSKAERVLLPAIPSVLVLLPDQCRCKGTAPTPCMMPSKAPKAQRLNRIVETLWRGRKKRPQTKRRHRQVSRNLRRRGKQLVDRQSTGLRWTSVGLAVPFPAKSQPAAERSSQIRQHSLVGWPLGLDGREWLSFFASGRDRFDKAETTGSAKGPYDQAKEAWPAGRGGPVTLQASSQERPAANFKSSISPFRWRACSASLSASLRRAPVRNLPGNCAMS